MNPFKKLTTNDEWTTFYRRCMVCGQESEHTVKTADYDAWRSGTLIQDVWPNHSLETRELMISGTHPACWDTLAPDDEDGEW